MHDKTEGKRGIPLAEVCGHQGHLADIGDRGILDTLPSIPAVLRQQLE